MAGEEQKSFMDMLQAVQDPENRGKFAQQLAEILEPPPPDSLDALTQIGSPAQALQPGYGQQSPGAQVPLMQQQGGGNPFTQFLSAPQATQQTAKQTPESATLADKIRGTY